MAKKFYLNLARLPIPPRGQRDYQRYKKTPVESKRALEFCPDKFGGGRLNRLAVFLRPDNFRSQGNDTAHESPLR
jgi:hypothetical protein